MLRIITSKNLRVKAEAVSRTIFSWPVMRLKNILKAHRWRQNYSRCRNEEDVAAALPRRYITQPGANPKNTLLTLLSFYKFIKSFFSE